MFIIRYTCHNNICLYICMYNVKLYFIRELLILYKINSFNNISHKRVLLNFIKLIYFPTDAC